jgi:trehalose 6-phosphate synthase/phosphatase
MDFDIDWHMVKNIAVPIMKRFVARTNGTCLTPRIPGIGFSYFGADPDWGEKQAEQLRLELEASLAKFDIKVTSQIQGSIEIVPKPLDKGIFVLLFLQRVMDLRGGMFPVMTTVIGDESSDDLMHTALYRQAACSSPGSHPKGMKLFTLTVGKRESPADLYVNEVSLSLSHMLFRPREHVFTQAMFPQRILHLSPLHLFNPDANPNAPSILLN